jgi:hypothetical protein
MALSPDPSPVPRFEDHIGDYLASRIQQLTDLGEYFGTAAASIKWCENFSPICGLAFAKQLLLRRANCL